MGPPARYRVKKVIGRGGMAEVLEATALGEGGFERRVALKRVLPEHGGDLSFQQGFIDEARIASQLHHANIVSVFDFGIMDDAPFIAMEYVDGLDVARFAALADESKIAIPAEIALHVATEIGHALAYAHEAKDRRGNSLEIVHRDVSPANVLISWAGDIKLADFGIARAADRLSSTRVGVAKGNLDYMAPEQLERSGVDARADQFGLACVLHYMLARRTASRGEIDPNIPEDIAVIIARATKPDRELRYPHVKAMTAELGSALAPRLKRDARTTMQRWLDEFSATTQPSSGPPGLTVQKSQVPADRLGSPAASPALAAMFDLELAPSENSDDVRHFTSTLVLPSSGDATASRDRPPPARTTSDPMIGRVLHGYRLVEQIGEGSYARVYRAKHGVLGREAAVKILHAKYGRSAEAVTRFRREARVLAGVQHPNVVGALDFGLTEEQLPFLVMEMLRGETLAEVIEAGPIPKKRVSAIARQLLSGLSAAHRAGLVHRDLKARNVMLVRGPNNSEIIKILDFGVARVFAPAGEDLTRITNTDAILGTPAYMAPEQIIGASTIGPTADLYSFGVMLFEMLAGRRPFHGSVPDVISAHLSQPPPELTTSGPLESLTKELLEKDPLRRPQSADAVLAKLSSSAENQSRARGPIIVFAASAAVGAVIALFLVLPRESAAPVNVNAEPNPAEARPRAVQGNLPPEVENPVASREEPRNRAVATKKLAAEPVKEEPKEQHNEPPTPAVITEELLRERITRVATALASAAETRPQEEVVALEKRYFELRKLARPPLDRDRSAAVPEKLQALEKDLRL